MPANIFPPRALPARFRRPRILIVGCGDVGQRVAALAPRGVHLLALTSQTRNVPTLGQQGIRAVVGNLDDARSLRRLAGVAQRVLHLAPPPGQGGQDTRTAALLRALGMGVRRPRTLVYGSTTGVYGDCAGAWVDETRATAARTERARRRVDAEQRVRAWARGAPGHASKTRATVLRIPGIYAPNREGGTPRTRLEKGLPVLNAEDDVFTNHIHADDLARACWAALWRAKPQRVVHVCDDTELHMGEYFDLAADLYGMPRPPRISRAQAAQVLPAVMLSFMAESRRLRNARMKQELKLRLRYPTVREGLQST